MALGLSLGLLLWGIFPYPKLWRTATAMMPAPPTITRFAPSPTGWLHLGHAYAALLAWRAALAGFPE